MGPSINDINHLGGRGRSAKRGSCSISLFRKMGDKGERGVKISQKIGDVIYGCPLLKKWDMAVINIFDGIFLPLKSEYINSKAH